MDTQFNLVDEAWIPVADVGRVSLGEIFSRPDLRALGGNPVQKIAILKLLLAICQAAVPLQDEETWQALAPETLARQCLRYLEKWHDRFDLYGNRPFLQMPTISGANQQSYGAVLPEIATGNTTVLSQFQQEKPLDAPDRALLLVTLMGFALGGKKTDHLTVLSPGYAKARTSKPGPAVAFQGILHSFVLAETLLKTLWLNLFTEEIVADTNMFPTGLGTAPWESMPEGEDCSVAAQLKQSLMGRLVPLSRFCLLEGDGLRYTEGIVHPTYKEGVADPSVAVDWSKKQAKVIWADPEKRPWRQLPALLEFIRQSEKRYDCLQLRMALPRARSRLQRVAVWSGGLKVSSNAGEQYVSGSDDFVESEVWLQTNFVDEFWFGQLQKEMKSLEDISKQLYACIREYFKEQKVDGAGLARQGTNLYWQQCENHFQDLVNGCDPSAGDTELPGLRRRFVSIAWNTYDRFCPADTARQLDTWARCRPNFAKYLNEEGA